MIILHTQDKLFAFMRRYGVQKHENIFESQSWGTWSEDHDTQMSSHKNIKLSRLAIAFVQA